MAVLLLHHPKKGCTLDGQAARGSGGLVGAVDVSLEMHTFKRARDGDRRRIVYGYSRHEATPRNHIIELTADGTDYRSLGTLADQEFEETWERLRRTHRPTAGRPVWVAAGAAAPPRLPTVAHPLTSTVS